METATVSSEYRVVIPRRIRDALVIRAGQKLQVLLCDGRIEMIPIKTIREMRGILKGIGTTIEREDDHI